MSVFDDIGGFIKDAVGGIGNIVGLVASAGATLLAGPGYAIPVFIGAAAATNALVRQRRLSDPGAAAQRDFARSVFGDTLPFERIVLTNLSGAGGREFVVPNALGEYVVNLGPGFDDPLNYTRGAYPRPGQVFIHELVHAWQYHYSGFAPGLLCENIVTQFRHTILGQNAYNKAAILNGSIVGRHWRDYNSEEQATLIDVSFQLAPSGMMFDIPDANSDLRAMLQPYRTHNLLAGNPRADYTPVMPPSQLPLLVSDQPGVWWDVTYADGHTRRVWFYRDGTAKYGPVKNGLLVGYLGDKVAAVASRPPLAARPLVATAVSARAGISSAVAAPARSISSLVGTSVGSRVAVRPQPITPAIVGSEGNGRWTFRGGKVHVVWNVGAEEWDVPLNPAGQTGRSTVGGPAFTARKVFPAPGPEPIIR